MRILFTTPILEYPAAGGPQLRIETSIKALARVAELDIISRSPPVLSGGDAAETFYRPLAQEFHIVPWVKRISGNRYLRKAQRVWADLTGSAVEEEARFILDHVQRRNISLIWFGFGNISFPLIKRIKELRPDLKLICDTDSVWSRFILRELPYAKGLRRLLIGYRGAQKEQEEEAWCDLCDLTTAVSEVDAEYYRSIAKDPSKIKIFSNVIDVASYTSPPPPPPGLKKPSIYLAGTFGHTHSPMDTAARWMLDEVLPLVLAKRPDVHFYLVGKDSDRMWGHLTDPHITVTGKLPTVLPYLCNVNVALVPLKYESGTRFKILEAGACKVPLVSTTLGAEGIPVQHGKDILIADTAPDFAEAIIRLLDDPNLGQSLAANCYDLVSKNYSVEALQREAAAILESFKA